ncbi:permease for cytosine/purines, uracil, thiamine, allantoin [Clostridium ragsdalei P11]|uniref:Permease for cytosine/purines, uracil, thiamine, allantoin n=1 Tax=Clostridium ragsdalei P11 TaxID=1353534 RepID=A0A1A6AWG2_9CLOT|nr:cytosine permease [Clostridium ragsdalei]OBR94387.1 permease for cytosine/purines, uracil, thiamine, allantoin [Clostridium ragsdalei P11]
MNESKKTSIFLPHEERNGKPLDLFFLWCAANIGILGLVYGAIIIGFKLSFFQSVLVTIVGSLSFILVGIMSLAGKETGAITFILSRAPFGFKGNYIPSIIALVGHMGWLSINVCTGTLTTVSLFVTLGFKSNNILTAISLGIFIILVLISVLFSHETLIKIQTIFTYLFGSLTLIILAILIPKTNWNLLLNMKSGSWIGNFLPAVAFVMAGTGISWSSASADYSCHQNPKNSSRSVAASVTLGGAVPLIIIMGVGLLLSTAVPDLANSSNPTQVIRGALPRWIAIIYYLTAIGGLTPQCFLGLKSSKLLLDAINIHAKNASVVIFQALIIIILPSYILFIAQDFQGTLESFLGILGKLLAAWSSVFFIDYLFIRKKHGYSRKLLEDKNFNPINYRGVISWLIGFVVGLLFSNTFIFNGPFAVGIFKGNSLNVLLTFVVSGAVYYFIGVLSGKSTVYTESTGGELNE